MKRNDMAAALAAAGLALITAGCATQATRIQAGGPTALTTMDINLLDFKDAAGQTVQAILRSPVLSSFRAQSGGQPPRIKVGRIINKTSTQIDLAQIAGRINEDLLNSGLVRLVADDAASIAASAEDAFMSDAKVNASHVADFYLEGTISQLRAKAGGTREKTYTFQLRLNDRGRNTVFQKTVDISKQGGRGVSTIGW